MNIILKNAVSNDFIEKIDVSSTKLVSLSIDGQSNVIGLKSTYKATGHYDNDTTNDLTNVVKWSIESGSGYAEIEKGELSILPSASSQQSITIKAEYNGIYNTKSIYVTYDLGIDEFTKSAILSSGNSFSDSQKLAIDSFFKAIGATEGTGIWSKLKKVYLPILAVDIHKAIVDYKLNHNDYQDIDTEYWELRSKGLVVKKNTTSTSSSILVSENENTDVYDFSCFAFNTEELKTSNDSTTRRSSVYSNYMKQGSSSDNYFVFIELAMTGSAGDMQRIGVTANSNDVGAESIIPNETTFIKDRSKNLRGVSIHNTEITALFSNTVDGSSPLKKLSSSKIKQNISDNGPQYLLCNLNGVVNDYEYRTPFGMIMWGTHLEDSEIITLQNETKKLYDKLVE